MVTYPWSHDDYAWLTSSVLLMLCFFECRVGAWLSDGEVPYNVHHLGVRVEVGSGGAVG